MKKIIQIIAITVLSVASVNGQIYLTENFDGAFSGNPAAPTGWTQSRVVLLGDGAPEIGASTNGEKDWEQNTNTGVATWSTSPGLGTFPNAAVSGSNVLFMNDAYFGSTANAYGARRMESPIVNLASSTNPYARFFYFCGHSSSTMILRLVASNDGGATWTPIMFISPNANVTTFASATPWQRINVKIPAAFKVANAKFGLEMSNTWGSQNIWIDDFSVEEFTPTTITSLTSGGWNNPATWVGGVVPNADNHVVIAPTHTVQTDVNIARMQNLTVDGVMTYSSTSTTQLNHIFGDLNVSATGLYFSGNGTTGKRTYVGGNIVNTGTINFQPGTSATGALVWTGYASSYSGAGTIFNNRVPIVVHAASGGVQYLNSFTVSNTCALYVGNVNGNNLTFGNPPASGAFLVEKCHGNLTNLPTFNNTNVTQRNLTFINQAIGQGGIVFATNQANVSPTDEVEIISGTRQVTGALTLNTHNNVVLNYPLSVGTNTGTQNISLSRGILITTTTNILTLNTSATGATGAVPTTVVNNGTNGGTHGSYVNGPVKINFPSTGTTARTFPLGQGTSFHTNLPSTNVNRHLILNAGATAWNSQTITATIENAPSGAVNAPVNLVMGSRAYRLNLNGGPGLAATNDIQIRFNNSTFGGSDNLVGNLQDIRVVQSPNLTGPWSERSLTSGTGLIVGNTVYTRNTAITSPGPINNGDQYFAWGSTGAAVDMAGTSLANPLAAGCYGPNQTVAVQITNSGIANMDFSVNNATITSDVSGAVTLTFTPIVLTSGTLAVGASQTVIVTNTFNMSTVGTYSFNASVSAVGDMNAVNNAIPTATRIVIAPVNIPQTVDFTGFTGANLSTLFPGWNEATGVLPGGTTSAWLNQTGVSTATNVTARLNLFTNTRNEWILSPKFTASTTTQMTFDAAVTDWNSTTAADVMGSDDKVRVMVSTDCGATYVPIFTISATNSLTTNFTNFTIPLNAYAGQDIIVGFYATDGPTDDAEDYDFHLDNINIINPIANDAGVTSMQTPSTVGCYSSSEPVKVVIKNFGALTQTLIPVTVVVSGAINQTITTNFTGSLAQNATIAVTVGTINMSTIGTYSFNAFTSLTGDGNSANDAMAQTTRSVIAALAFPYVQDFNSNTILPAGMVASGPAPLSVVANHGANYNNNALTRNIYGTTFTLSVLDLPKLGLAAANTVLSYDYRIQDWSGYPSSAATSLANWANDSLNVYVSSNCGLTYSLVQTTNASNHTPTVALTTKSVSLGSFAGNNIIVRFVFKKAPGGTGDYYADLDNINVLTPLPDDVGATELVAPGLIGCYSASEPVVIKIKNYGINTQTAVPVTVVVSGAINQTLTGTYIGSIAPSATVNFNIGNINMSTIGTYSFNAVTSLTNDNQPANDAMVVATRTVIGALALPYTQDFNSSTILPAGMVVSGPAPLSVFANHGANYNNNALSRNIYGTTNTLSILDLPKLGTVTANTTLKYDYRIQDWSGYPSSAATTTLNWANDSLNVLISTDCGITYTMVQSTNASNHTPTVSLTTKTVNLAAYAGNNIIIRFVVKKDPAGTGDYYSDIDNINICAGPPNAPVASATSICTGTNAIVTTSATGNAQWYASNTATAYIATGNSYTTPILTSNTTYYVLDSTACGLSSLTPITVTVNAVPSVTVNSSNLTICQGNSATLTATGANTYSWNTNATTSVIVVSPTITTTYSVVGSASGCPDSNASQSITVNAAPTINAIAGSNTICVGSTVNITASGANTYTWSTNATTNTISVSPTVTTTYSVSGTNSLNCVGNKTISINVNPKPTVSLSAASNTACVNGGTVGLTGTPSGGIYSGSNVTGNALNPTATGTFSPVYSYTDSTTGCSNSATTTIVVSICTGINEAGNSAASYLNVYPNPNTGSFTIETNNDLTKSISINDVTGRVVYAKSTDASVIQMAINELANGIYYVTIKTNLRTDVIKIIKQ